MGQKVEDIELEYLYIGDNFAGIALVADFFSPRGGDVSAIFKRYSSSRMNMLVDTKGTNFTLRVSPEPLTHPVAWEVRVREYKIGPPVNVGIRVKELMDSPSEAIEIRQFILPTVRNCVGFCVVHAPMLKLLSGSGVGGHYR
jgi:hypothetical protein